jgi:hypothetical protein
MNVDREGGFGNSRSANWKVTGITQVLLTDMGIARIVLGL